MFVNILLLSFVFVLSFLFIDYLFNFDLTRIDTLIITFHLHYTLLVDLTTRLYLYPTGLEYLFRQNSTNWQCQITLLTEWMGR